MSIVNDIKGFFTAKKPEHRDTPQVGGSGTLENIGAKRRTMPRSMRRKGAPREQKVSNHVAKCKTGYNQLKDMEAGRRYNQGVKR